MSTSGEGGPLARFELDVRADREISVLRGVLAAVLMMAGFWGLLVPHTVTRLAGVAACVFAVLWLARARTLLRRAQHPELHFLELCADRLRVGHPEGVTETLWKDVQGIELDEDSLRIRVHRRDQHELEIEPDYHGIDLYDLRDALFEAWNRGRGVRAPEG